MPVTISTLDRFKVETEFGDSYVVQTTYDWVFSERGLKEMATWTNVKLLGSGAFGSVWLEQKKNGGQLSAVKKLSRESVVRTGFSQEVIALATLIDVNTPLLIEPGFYWADERYLSSINTCLSSSLAGTKAVARYFWPWSTSDTGI